MSMETIHRVRCDEPGCTTVCSANGATPQLARANAGAMRWDLGPRPDGKGAISRADYCPYHRKRDVEIVVTA